MATFLKNELVNLLDKSIIIQNSLKILLDKLKIYEQNNKEPLEQEPLLIEIQVVRNNRTLKKIKMPRINYKGNLEYYITRQRKKRIYNIYNRDDYEGAWLTYVHPVSMTNLVKKWVDKGLVLKRGDIIHIENYDVIESCLSYYKGPTFYWDGKKTRPIEPIYGGIFYIDDNITFPEFPMDYYHKLFPGIFKLSPKLHEQVLQNLKYGIPPINSEPKLRKKMVYSWFDTGLKKDDLIAILNKYLPTDISNLVANHIGFRYWVLAICNKQKQFRQKAYTNFEKNSIYYYTHPRKKTITPLDHEYILYKIGYNIN